MRPSEFEAIRSHLQEASDGIDAYLKEKQALEDEELDELASRYFAALPQGTPSEMEPHKAPETAPAKLPRASPLCATLIENCQPWRYLSAQAAADLRDCRWIKEAEAIDEVLRGLPTGPIQDHQSKLMDEQLDRCRKGAERIRTILAACLAGSTPPADQANEGEGNGGKALTIVASAAETAPDQPVLPIPVQWLTNWREILVALGMKDNKEDQDKVKKLNKAYSGPIVIPKQGAQPKVDKLKLLEWWNGLEQKFWDEKQRQKDTKATAAAQHPYGQGGIVAPDVSGGVKKRRDSAR
jgi:hypothetical protein